MVKQIVALSGPVTAGKSTLAESLVARFGYQRVRTRELLRKIIDAPDHIARRQLQAAGAQLDRRTGGRWVADQLERDIRQEPEESLIVVDAVRIQEQVEALYRAYGAKVVHLHLTAPPDELERRYSERSQETAGELASYAQVRADPTEAAVGDLELTADVVIDTARSTPSDVLVRAAARLGLYRPAGSQLVDVLVGGQYGSEGKGNIAYYLAREYAVLVRVGGPNAGHTVMDWSDQEYIHHQLPSGTRSSPSAQLVIGPGATLRIPDLLEEIAECGVEYQRLAIDPQAMIISDQDILQEDELKKSIGSTAQGVGAAAARRINGRTVGTVRLATHFPDLEPFLRETGEVLEDAYIRGDAVLLEGTQGTGLSLFHGSYPYVTSRDTTVAGCLAEAGIAPARVRRVVMTCRTYPIRVQNPRGSTSGPMSQEISWTTVAERSGLDKRRLMRKEKTSTTKRQRRVAEFDWAQLSRSAQLNAPTDIALTFVDYIDKRNADARRFDQLTPETIRFVEEVEAVAQAPVNLLSTRFHSRSVIDRRNW